MIQEIKSPELIAFEETWKTLNWSAMTTTQKNTHISNHYALKIASAKWVEQQKIESENQAVIDNAAFHAKAVAYLKKHGFKVDNSPGDWDRLYNRPAIFGANWQDQSDYQQSISTGVDYFIQVVYGLWVEFVKEE